jgi:hypothetical protein
MAYAVYSGGLLTRGAESEGRFTMAGAQATANAAVGGAEFTANAQITAAREQAADRRIREQREYEAQKAAAAQQQELQNRNAKQDMLNQLVRAKDENGRPLVPAKDVATLNRMSDVADSRDLVDQANRTAAKYSSVGNGRNILNQGLKHHGEVIEALKSGDAVAVQKAQQKASDFREKHSDFFRALPEDHVIIKADPNLRGLASTMSRFLEGAAEKEYAAINPELAQANTPGSAAFFQAAGYGSERARILEVARTTDSAVGTTERAEVDTVMRRANEIMAQSKRDTVAALRSARETLGGDAAEHLKALRAEPISAIDAVRQARVEFGDSVAPVRAAFDEAFKADGFDNMGATASYAATQLRGMEPDAVHALLSSVLSSGKSQPQVALESRRVINALHSGGRAAVEAYSELSGGPVLEGIIREHGAEASAQAVSDFVKSDDDGYARAKGNARTLAASGIARDDPALRRELHDYVMNTAFAQSMGLPDQNTNALLGTKLESRGAILTRSVSENGAVVGLGAYERLIADDAAPDHIREVAKAIHAVETGSSEVSEDDIYLSTLASPDATPLEIIDAVTDYQNAHAGEFGEERDRALEALLVAGRYHHESPAGESGASANLVNELHLAADPQSPETLGRFSEELNKPLAAVKADAEAIHNSLSGFEDFGKPLAAAIRGALDKKRSSELTEDELFNAYHATSAKLYGEGSAALPRLISFTQFKRLLHVWDMDSAERAVGASGPSGVGAPGPAGLDQEASTLMGKDRVLGAGFLEYDPGTKQMSVSSGATLTTPIQRTLSNSQPYGGKRYDLGTREGISSYASAALGVSASKLKDTAVRVEKYKADLEQYAIYKRNGNKDLTSELERYQPTSRMTIAGAANEIRAIGEVVGSPALIKAAGNMKNPEEALRQSQAAELAKLKVLREKEELIYTRTRVDTLSRKTAAQIKYLEVKATSEHDENLRDAAAADMDAVME